MQSENTNELAAALAKAQGAMTHATMDRINPHFKNKYATLNAIWDAIRQPLASNGLSITQTTDIRDNGAFVLVTTMRHASGQYVSGVRPLPVGKPQEMGSAETYAKRYALASMVGITADEDDDAEATRTNGQTVPPPKPRENPHVTRVEDVTDRRPRHDENGNRIDWIDTSMHRVKHLTGENAKAVYKTLRAAMRVCETPEELVEWGVEHAEQVASLGKTEDFFQLVEYQAYLDELRDATKNGKAA